MVKVIDCIAKIKKLIEERDNVSEQSAQDLAKNILAISNEPKTVIRACGLVIAEMDNEITEQKKLIAKLRFSKK